jgi:hypothetical protein
MVMYDVSAAGRTQASMHICPPDCSVEFSALLFDTDMNPAPPRLSAWFTDEYCAPAYEANITNAQHAMIPVRFILASFNVGA